MRDLLYYEVGMLRKALAGFGLGALNEADDDDLDVYDTSLPAERTYMPYDAADREPDDTITLAGRRKAHTQRAPVQIVRLNSYSSRSSRTTFTPVSRLGLRNRRSKMGQMCFMALYLPPSRLRRT